MTRWCSIHKGNVLDGDAEIVRATDTGPAQSTATVYACMPCIRREGLTTVERRATYIGRRDGSPSADRGSA